MRVRSAEIIQSIHAYLLPPSEMTSVSRPEFRQTGLLLIFPFPYNPYLSFVKALSAPQNCYKQLLGS